MSESQVNNGGGSEEGYRLSPQQRRLWRLGTGWAHGLIRVRGAGDPDRLADAVGRAAGRHEALRTRFARLPAAELPLQVVCDRPPEVRRAGRLHRAGPDVLAGAAPNGFSTDDPAAPVSLLLLETEDGWLVEVTGPALCLDLASFDILRDDIAAAYSGTDSAPPLQYADVAEWLNEGLDPDYADPGRAHWRRRNQAPSVLPRSLAAAARGAGDGGDRPARRRLPGAAGVLRSIGLEVGADVDAAVTGLWAALLWRLGDGRLPALRVLLDGRRFQELGNVVGLLSRFVTVEPAPRPGMALPELTALTAAGLLEAVQWQDAFELQEPGDRASATIGLEMRPARRAVQAGGAWFDVLDAHAQLEPFALLASCRVVENDLELRMLSATDAPAAWAALDRLEVLAGAALADPGAPLEQLPLLRPEEARATDRLVNGAWRPPRSRRLLPAFAEQVDRHGGRCAVRAGPNALTYDELDARSDAVARRLRHAGARRGSVVALAIEPSVAWVVGMVGALKAGAAYLPLDVRLPERRLASMLDDADVGLAVAGTAEARMLGDRIACVVLGDDGSSQADGDPGAVPGLAAPSDVAYVIFTSGSTGAPKGVAVEERQLMAYVEGALERLRPPEAATYATPASLETDLSATAIFLALLSGGTLVLFPREAALDAELFATQMERAAVDVLKITPSYLQTLVMGAGGRALPRHTLILGGERCERTLLERVRELATGLRLVNHYGPTETTIGALAHAIEPVEPLPAEIPIGRPLAHARAHVLDPGGHATPIETVGELFIGGAGVARGYLGGAAATAAAFTPDAFGGEAGARLYATGDLARIRADGSIEFVGRADDQVKLRGFRVELGEVERALREHPAVAQAAAVVRGQGASAVLLAWVVAADGPSPDDLTAFVAERLPAHMVPHRIIRTSALPFTPSGKLDRRSLELLDAHESPSRPGRPPSSALERAIAGVFSEVLDTEVEDVSRTFFQLGGQSLLATLAIARLREALQVELSVETFFERASVAELAAAIGEQRDPVEVERIAELFLLVQGLPDEAVERLLRGQPET